MSIEIKQKKENWSIEIREIFCFNSYNEMKLELEKIIDSKNKFGQCYNKK